MCAQQQDSGTHVAAQAARVPGTDELHVNRLAHTCERICETQESQICYLSLPQQICCYLSPDKDISREWNKTTFGVGCHKTAFLDQIAKVRRQFFKNRKYNYNNKYF